MEEVTEEEEECNDDIIRASSSTAVESGNTTTSSRSNTIKNSPSVERIRCILLPKNLSSSMIQQLPTIDNIDDWESEDYYEVDDEE